MLVHEMLRQSSRDSGIERSLRNDRRLFSGPDPGPGAPLMTGVRASAHMSSCLLTSFGNGWMLTAEEGFFIFLWCSATAGGSNGDGGRSYDCLMFPLCRGGKICEILAEKSASFSALWASEMPGRSDLKLQACCMRLCESQAEPTYHTLHRNSSVSSF